MTSIMTKEHRIKYAYLLRGEFRNCLICKVEFYAIPGNIKKGKGIYCSRRCYGQARSIFTKGVSCKWNKNRIPWNKGKKLPEQSGIKHHAWKGGTKKSRKKELGLILPLGHTSSNGNQ